MAGTTTRKRPTARLNILTPAQVWKSAEGDLSDGGGLVLRAQGPHPAPASFFWRYTAPDGRRRDLGLGACRRNSLAMAGASLTAARDEAQRARAKLAAGIDPLDERNAIRQADRQAAQAAAAERAQAEAVERWTLARCARDYHERVIEKTRTPKHSAQWIASLENHVPAALWHRPIATIQAPELLEALSSIQPHERARNLPHGAALPETTTRIRQRLDAVFEDAIFHGRATVNQAAAILRKMKEAAPKRERGEHRALPYREAPALMGRIRTAPGTAARALEWAVLTASRTGEALGTRWEEIDFEAGVWVCPAERMKGGEPHTVYLSAQALALLESLPGERVGLVFPSPTDPERALSNMAMLTVLTRLQVREATTVHGLCRATFSTWANETGAARPDVIEACLAHNERDRVRKAYNRAEFAAERRALLEAWGAFVYRTAEVIELRKMGEKE